MTEAVASIAAAKARAEHVSRIIDGSDLPEGVGACTDLANAHRLCQEFEGELLYTRGLGWLVYDGARYDQDASGAAARRMHEVTRRLRSQAAALMHAASRATDKERANQLSALAGALDGWAKKSQQEPRLKAGLAVASSLEGIACAATDFDRDPWVLNTPSGMLDLRTGKLTEHAKVARLTKLTGAPYVPTAECPTWVAFLQRIFAGRADLVDFVRRAFGYSLTGVTVEQCFFVLYGSGANGKSTALETIRSVLGDYAMATGTDTFLRTRDSRGPENDVARLRGARFVSAVESGEGRKLDEERIKRITGGDTMTARFLYREPFEFVPSCKVWLAVNDRPEITGVDHGIWRRVRLIPFDVTIPDHEQDQELTAKLRAEGPGILRWLVEGCREWQQGGLRPPAAVLLATEDWRHESNIVAKFVDECCNRGEALSVKAGTLAKQFGEWATEQGETPMAGKALAARLRTLGFKADRNGRTRLWRGLSIRSEVTE